MSGDQGSKQHHQLSSQWGIQRRRFLKIALGLGAATAAILYFGPLKFSSPTSKKESELTPPLERMASSRLEEFADNIVSGGPPKDGIPPIDNPKYVSSDTGDTFLGENDTIFGLEHKGTVRAYPQMILVWHEIVNDVIEGEKVSITYCPLTGSTVGFRGKSKIDDRELTFGTSGNLVNSNLLMYDRQTDSNWPQILATAINGPSKGDVLQQIPLDWTTWGKWRVRHPSTEVLSMDTGYRRPYGRDPYGSYPGRSGYYFYEGTIFPVMTRDSRFHSKKVVIGIEAGEAKLAVDKDEFRAKGLDNVLVGAEPILLLYDVDLDVVRAYSRRVGGQTLKFILDDGRIFDRQTGSEWTSTGLSIKGRLAYTQLKTINYFDVMWFAWYAFYPETEVYA